MKVSQPHLDALFRDRPMTEIDALASANDAQLWSASRIEGSPRRRFLDGAIHTAVIICGLITLTICGERLYTLPSTPAAVTTTLVRATETIHGTAPATAKVMPATAQPIDCSFDVSTMTEALKTSPKLF